MSLTVDMAGNKHKALLDELAHHCGAAVTSREEPPGNLAAAREVSAERRAQSKERVAVKKAEADAKHSQALARLDERRRELASNPKSVARSEKRQALHEKTKRLEKRVSVVGKNCAVVFDGESQLEIRTGVFAKKTYAVDESVSAVVDTATQLGARPTMTRTAAGMVVAGPLGALLGATAWKKGGGALFLAIEGADWAELVEVEQRRAADARRLAQRVNLAAKLAREARGIPEESSPGTGESAAASEVSTAIDQLERLTRLRDQGVLTAEEFEEQKRRVLGNREP